MGPAYPQGCRARKSNSLSRIGRWRSSSRRCTGGGLIVAVTFATELGHASRFDSPRQPAIYVGLGPGERWSDEIIRKGGTTVNYGPNRHNRPV